ncbi:VWA domain-containing protein [Dyadobacter sp. CY323]|uniref:vWA domain-containing protein n=1 Tax=Dyadobacter sp. CY323 TaxID=2907302 RepID=UPI001F352FA7|nr:VWA domain-containing protein [Dyadobacter sp. CY323]MCE6989616.1 VWA domain-containing protein [Dyadobacter sp. CY323]
MKRSLLTFLLFAAFVKIASGQTEPPQQALNHYVEFLNRSTAAVTDRFQMVRDYEEDVARYRKKQDVSLRLQSSGPLEEFYYQKALSATGITGAERQKLNKPSNALWELLNQLDETGKSLETHVRLNAYKDDNLKQSDKLVSKMLSLFNAYSREKAEFYQQIRQVYLKYQPYVASDPYLSTEKEMEHILLIQKQLLDSLPYYLHENTRAEWPVAAIQRSMLTDEKLLADFGKAQARLEYPASAVVPDFKEALQALQNIKRRAVDDHNFAAQQSATHGNDVYLSLINQYNNDLLVTHKSFINYSKSARRMLDFPAISPVMTDEAAETKSSKIAQTPPFQDKPLATFTTKRSATPMTSSLAGALNVYVEFINESLRQMHLMQVLVRNYQSSAEYYRDPEEARKRAGLTYSHDDFKIPLSAYQLLFRASNSMPQTYRAAINAQAEVLLKVLKEMDGLSVELIRYTTEKQYLEDQLSRSDAILDRYAILFEIFDQKKEQLYNDVRRIHESFPSANPAGSWNVAGKALLITVDDDHAVLFDVKAFLNGEKEKLPVTEKLEDGAKKLIEDEYQNLKGLKRYGRSNGLCPYSPYEDLAGNSARFAEKAQKVKPVSTSVGSHPYESFYYFYNNELIYQYNKFVELANAGLLKAVNQPDVFAFRRLSKQHVPVSPPGKTVVPPAEPETKSGPVTTVATQETAFVSQVNKPESAASANPANLTRDTVYVERVRVDTVYVDRHAGGQEVSRTLDGFAPNNMVLLLDVSSSMNSPFKMPLLKRSIKSLLTLLRPEDQISIVLYSGKARVVLKPTSGAKAAEISRMIDLLQSDGDTDGNEGIKLAYKTANKQFIRGGNNRIILATDGEFPVSNEVLTMIETNASQDLYLTIFTFGRNEHTGQKLKKLSQLGQGTYAHVTEESADLQLILEAQGKKRVR